MHIEGKWIATVGAAAGIVAVLLGGFMLLSHRSAPSPPASQPAPPPPATKHAAVVDRALTKPLNQPGGGPLPAAAYVVYSDLYRTPSGEPLVFAAKTETDIPQIDGSCLKPTTPEERQMVEAFEAANRMSHPVRPSFKIDEGFRLLDEKKADYAAYCIQAHFPGPECDEYKGLKHVRWLGAPGFAPDGQRALVSVIRRCGHYCGVGGIFVAEKKDGHWQHATTGPLTQQCSWMY
jgi:hypothetical protein